MELPEDTIPEILEKAEGEILLVVDEEREAQKVYKCSNCGENIYPGEVYLHRAWKDETGFHYYKQHQPEACW